MTKIYDSVDQLIGKTPIVKLNHVVPEDAADVYVKLEFFNPAGSIKDRIALSMLEAAKNQASLKTAVRSLNRLRVTPVSGWRWLRRPKDII